LKEKAFKLSALPDEKVDDRQATVLQVKTPEGEMFRLYFDKESNLPIRLTMKMTGERSGEEASFEELYSNYKEIQGIKKAMKIANGPAGKSRTEEELADYKFVEKVDDKLFAKP
jgi:hypothetical protein